MSEITLADLLGHIDRRFDKVDKQFADGEKRFDKLEYGQFETNAHLARLNGQVAKNVAAIGAQAGRLGEIEHRQRDEANVQRGRRAQRDDDLERVRTLRDFWPLVTGAVLGGVGVGSFLWGRGPW